MHCSGRRERLSDYQYSVPPHTAISEASHLYGDAAAATSVALYDTISMPFGDWSSKLDGPRQRTSSQRQQRRPP